MKRLLVAAGAMMALALPSFARAATSCGDLKATSLPHAEVTSATNETSAGVALCRVNVTSRPTADSDIRIELWIPVGAAWNGKFLQVGNGGFAGAIRSGQLKALAAGGYAVAGTDNGHQSPVATSAAWALGHPEKIVDFGWRSLKETTDVSKALIAAQRGGGPKLSYFFGCSDGGREALMEAQRFPADFDGIVAGAPANYMSLLFGNGAAQQQALARPGAYLGKAQLNLLQASALKQCGGEAFIRDPAACRFDPGQLICAKGQTENCLSSAQAAAARAIYAGRRDPRTGRIALAGISPGGEALSGGWQAWITGAEQPRIGEAAGGQFSSNAFKYFAFQDPSFDFLKLDLGAEFDRAKAKMSPIIDSDSPNLSAFRKRGGKLIQFHGWNDPAIPAASSIRYYEDVRRTMGDTSSFYRTYLVPGMLHCGGGMGPSNVDWVSVLDKWVVDKAAPGPLTATSVANGSQLLCPYPGVARKDGQGGWSCSVTRKRG
jgi:Tannase and feruloyl esterase